MSVLTNASASASIGLHNARTQLKLLTWQTFCNFLFSTQTLYSDQFAWETQGLLGQKTQQLLNLWKVLCKIC
jgi:hypothetical protein